MNFEREFFSLASIWLACQGRCMGHEVYESDDPGAKPITHGAGPVSFRFDGERLGGELAFQCLGIHDYVEEMRLICEERINLLTVAG